jgi:hypothetical protein
MTKIFDDGILEVILYPSKWVFVRWIQNKHGRLQKTLIKDLMETEQKIWANKWHGWFTLSEEHHKDFHKLLTKFGAVPREVKDGMQWFIKPLLKEGDLHVR